MQLSQSLRSLVVTAAACAIVVAAAAPVLGQGTVAVSPVSFNRGGSVTITYNATGGPISGSTQMFFFHGFNGFQGVTEPAMTNIGANQWSYTFNFPSNATVVNFVFRNQFNQFDNNLGRDWHRTIDLTGAPLGTSFVLPANGGGTIFRVWAPNATTVNLAGQFNSFSTSNYPMTKDAATGIWSTFVNVSAGQNYKFHLNGNTWRWDPRARALTSSVGNSVLVNPSAYNWGSVSYTPPPFNRQVIYQLHVGSFEPNGGPIPGSFTDAGTRFGYIQDMGFNMVQVLPVSEFPGAISWGYNLVQPFTIEADYGTPDQFRDFVKGLQTLGIGVIMDVVHNHYGPSDLDLYNFDGGTTGGIYFYDTPASLANTPFGPRPDFANAQVRAYIKDNIRMWFDEYRINGLRWDFTKGIRGVVDGSFNVTSPIPEGISLLREINDDVALSYSGRIRIAEDLAGDSLITTPTSNPNGLGFDTQWDGSFHNDVIGELKKATDSSRDMNVLAGQIDRGFARLHYLESHDSVAAANGNQRITQELDSVNPNSYFARKMHALGATMLMTSEGIPMVFMGGELHSTGAWSDATALDWTRLGNANYNGIRQAYRTLTRLRTNAAGTTAGLTGNNTDVFINLDSIKVMGYRRYTGGSAPGDDVVILANFSSVSYPAFDIGMPRAGTWYQVFNSDSTTFGSDFTNVATSAATVTTVANPMHGYAQRATVGVGPYSAVVYTQAIPSGIPDWEAMQ